MADNYLLIVDDDGNTRTTLVDIFEDRGFQAITAGSGNEALREMELHPFGAALIDIRLPDMDGLQLLKHFKKKNPEIICVFITGNATIQNAAAALKEGADGYFIKPLIIDDVIHTVESALKRQELQKDIRESEERYRGLVETSTDAIILLNEEGRIILWNEAATRIFGHPREDVITESIERIIPPNSGAGIAQNLRNFLNSTDSSIMNTAHEIIGQTRDNKILPLELSLSILNRQPDRIYTLILRDISERKKADEERRLNQQYLLHTFEATIGALASALEIKDPYTAGHQRRVAGLACALARELEIGEDQINGINLAALIHDIGKIYVPAEILTKPGRITAEEFNIIQYHSRMGYDILKNIEFPWPIATIILQHHERMNGSGYPLGLKGDELLLESRIIMLADVVEAMSSHRPYRPARGIEIALDEITRNRNILYDGQVVDACIRLFRDRNFSIETNENNGLLHDPAAGIGDGAVQK